MRVTEASEVALGPWDGCSDHHPVCMATDHFLTHRITYGKKISWAKRKSRENKAIFGKRAAFAHCVMYHTAVSVEDELYVPEVY